MKTLIYIHYIYSKKKKSSFDEIMLMFLFNKNNLIVLKNTCN